MAATNQKNVSQNEQKYGSSQTGGSTSSTQYGSNTHSETNWDQHSRGGSHSTSASKSWSSGTVDEAVQAQKARAEAGYTAGTDVQDTKARLQDTLNGKPGAFSSSYQSKLDDLYNQIMGRDKFSYDFNKDEMYQMYKDQYQNMGRNAMRDTMGQAAAMTGGYGSSYAQTAGQQQYQNYLQQLNEIIPELRNQRYQEWLSEGQDLYNKYNLTNQAYNNEYGQYRDTVADWQSDRSFNQAAYESERNFDRSNFDADRAYYQSEFWNQRNAEQSNAAEANEENWNDSWGRSVTDSSTTGWQNTSGTNWSNTSGWSNSNSSSWVEDMLAQAAAPAAARTGGSSAVRNTASTYTPSTAGTSSYDPWQYFSNTNTTRKDPTLVGQNATYYNSSGQDTSDLQAQYNALVKRLQEEEQQKKRQTVQNSINYRPASTMNLLAPTYLR